MITDEQAMAICAIRYALGRRSYIVSDGTKWARKYGSQDWRVRLIICQDIEAAERIGDLGDPMDAEAWRSVLAELKAMPAPTDKGAP